MGKTTNLNWCRISAINSSCPQKFCYMLHLLLRKFASLFAAQMNTDQLQRPAFFPQYVYVSRWFIATSSISGFWFNNSPFQSWLESPQVPREAHQVLNWYEVKPYILQCICPFFLPPWRHARTVTKIVASRTVPLPEYAWISLLFFVVFLVLRLFAQVRKTN